VIGGVCGGNSLHTLFRKRTNTDMAKIEERKTEEKILKEFDLEARKDIVQIITDSPTLVSLGEKQFAIKNMRYYSLYRICNLVMDMKKADETLDTDNKVITALCTDLDAMCEIVAIVLCNHLFVPCENDDMDSLQDRNDRMISRMKAIVMSSTYNENQWAGIILEAIKSIDLSGFFLIKKSVSMLTDSILTRKKKSMETASQFMEAQSLLTQPTS
jgi:hypothetical protein